MSMDTHHKVTASHLKRDAYLYVRQSTLRQVLENTESTKRQYALRQQAVTLGWPTERVIVIDADQGQSGASAADREGFQNLMTQVTLGRAGIVLGLEVSRLARNSSDWHRLLEICSLTDTLILDEDGLYNPGHFNDRLLLGLKGTMSEAELHVLRSRLQGGIESKARRGELKMRLPIGLVYDEQDRVVLDPDRQVRQTLFAFFKAFDRTGTACATVKHFRQQGWLFPRRLGRGAKKGELLWAPLCHARALQTLRNPRYAGAFYRGRTRTWKDPNGRVRTRKLPMEEWSVLLPNSHAGYIDWEQFQRNLQRLNENAQAHGVDRRKSPPGEGPALLQGLAVCGLCGQPMTIRYRTRKQRLLPEYRCQREGIARAERICQAIPGATIDEAIGELLLELVTPATLEVALEVQQEVQSRIKEADRLRKQQVERARYETDLAERRYMQVDPSNRLVADALEAEWNARLRALEEAQQQYEQQQQTDRALVDERQRRQVLDLAGDFPKLWRDERTSHRERKRMTRLLIEDVTLTKGDHLLVQVRLKGGATRAMTLPLPLPSYKSWQTPPKIVAQIDRLLDDFTTGQVAAKLDEQGLRSGKGGRFTGVTIVNICHSYRLKSRYNRLRDKGMLTRDEIAQQLGIAKSTVSAWRRHQIIKAHVYDDRKRYLYEPVSDQKPVKCQGRKLVDPRRLTNLLFQDTKEV